MFAQRLERHDSILGPPSPQQLDLTDLPSRQDSSECRQDATLSEPEMSSALIYSQDLTSSMPRLQDQSNISTLTNEDLLLYPHIFNDTAITASLMANNNTANVIQQSGTIASCSEKLVLVKSKALLADKVEAACKRYLARSIKSGPLLGGEHQPPPHAQLNLSASRLLQPVSSAAIGVIARVSGLGSYMYGSVSVASSFMSHQTRISCTRRLTMVLSSVRTSTSVWKPSYSGDFATQ